MKHYEVFALRPQVGAISEAEGVGVFRAKNVAHAIQKAKGLGFHAPMIKEKQNVSVDEKKDALDDRARAYRGQSVASTGRASHARTGRGAGVPIRKPRGTTSIA